MPGFDSLADNIAGSYEPPATSEDSVGANYTGTTYGTPTNRDAASGLGSSTPATDQTKPPATNTTATNNGSLPFGFSTPEEAATGTPAGFDNLTGATGTASTSPALSSCQQCVIQAQQEQQAKESVCSTMKARVEAWFMENGCPIQIIPLPGQAQQCQMQQMQQMQQQFMVPQPPPQMQYYTSPCEMQQMQPYPSCMTGQCNAGT